ncbi:hypothetical protein Tco_0140384 [Tanacetum coccineum]
MSTLAKFMMVAGADNRPPMLDKPQYESWKRRMELYIQGKDNGRIILKSVENSPLVWPIVALENDTVRPKTYEELSDKEKIQADCDLKATNIVLQGTSLSKQERECKMYDEFDKFSYAKDAYPPPTIPQQPQAEFSQIDSGLAVPTFLPGDDLIACMNKAMAFFSAVFTPHYPSTNNQLRSSSNLRNQATVQDGSQGNASGSRGNTSGQVKVIKCYNCQAQAQGKELDEEKLAFLADPGVTDGQVG